MRTAGLRQARAWIDRLRGYRLRGLPKCSITLSERLDAPRLNVIVVGISKGAVFGGIETALRFFNAMRHFFPRARIVVLFEDESSFDAKAWPGWELETRRPDAARTIVYLAQKGACPAVEANDRFIATSWLTAYYVNDLYRISREAGRLPVPFIYLLQDFEPGFYPWSGRYLVAIATYSIEEPVIAIFNTDILRNYFISQGYDYTDYHVFEPRLNPSLARYHPKLFGHTKRRQLIVYGRPGSPRNAFDLVVETLLVWARRYAGARNWEVLSLGEKHRDVPLGGGLILRALGKLSLDEYASHLLDAAVGLSLMVSPHPSYPPLEMAEFGVRVVTNRFANKDLSERSPNIVSVVDTSPDHLAAALARCCEAHERGDPWSAAGGAFLGGEDEFPFMADLAARLLAARS